MKNFNRDGKSGGRRGFGGRDSGKSSMHKAICDECGRSCEVPFKPSGDKPIYCNSCFKAKRSGGGGSKRSSERSHKKSVFGEKQMYAAKCSGCGNTCEVPFRPTGDKSVYCNQCFEKNKSSGKSTNDGQLKEQFNILNAKLDEILKILSPVAVALTHVVEKKSTLKEEIVEEIKEPKTKKETKIKEKAANAPKAGNAKDEKIAAKPARNAAQSVADRKTPAKKKK